MCVSVTTSMTRGGKACNSRLLASLVMPIVHEADGTSDKVSDIVHRTGFGLQRRDPPSAIHASTTSRTTPSPRATHPITVRPAQPDLASRVHPSSAPSGRSGRRGRRLNPDGRGGRGRFNWGGFDPGGRGRRDLLSSRRFGRLGSRGPGVGSSRSSGLLNRSRSGRLGDRSRSLGSTSHRSTAAQPSSTSLLSDPASLARSRSPLPDPPLGIGPDGSDFVGPVLQPGLLESTGEVVVMTPGRVGDRGGVGGRDGLSGVEATYHPLSAL
jgi:hypothetical protein